MQFALTRPRNHTASPTDQEKSKKSYFDANVVSRSGTAQNGNWGSGGGGAPAWFGRSWTLHG